MQGEEGSRQAPLFKTELIRPHGPWHGLDNLELSTLEYIDWFNHRRLHSQIGMIPPALPLEITTALAGHWSARSTSLSSDALSA